MLLSALPSTPALDFVAQTACRKTNPESLPSCKEDPGQGLFHMQRAGGTAHLSALWHTSTAGVLVPLSCCLVPCLACSSSGSARELGKTALPCLSLGQVPLSKAGSLARQPNTEGPCGLDWNIFPQKRSQAGRCSGEGVGILETVQLSVAAFDSKDVLRRKGLLSQPDFPWEH